MFGFWQEASAPTFAETPLDAAVRSGPVEMRSSLKPFVIDWPEPAIRALRHRVADFRRPTIIGPPGWDYGPDDLYFADLMTHWARDFDFRQALSRLNRFPQFTAGIGDRVVHFIHVVGEARGARPILLAHGWPGTVFEFEPLIERLAYPSRFGGRGEDAFDVVVPSLPGFLYSDLGAAPVGPKSTAELFDALMRKVLGYDRYLMHGTDFGAAIAAVAALGTPEAVRSIHLTLLGTAPAAEPSSTDEKTWQEADARQQKKFGAYSDLQRTKPKSIGVAMLDNPVAQAAWLTERFHDWSDRRARPFEVVVPRDLMLSIISAYVLSGTLHSSFWFYAGLVQDGSAALRPGERVSVPTAFSAFPDPRHPPPPREFVV